MEWPTTKPYVWSTLAKLSQRSGLSRVAAGHRDVVLMYHSVGGIHGTEYAFDLPEHLFREQIRWLAERWAPADLPELIETDAEHKRFAVTFDDGFRNVAEVAVPILREFEVPATVFLCSEFIGDANAELLRERHGMRSRARDVVMTDRQVREAIDDELLTVGNHTASHPDLTSLPDRDAVQAEVVGGKRELEARYGVTVDRFSYPYGRVDSRTAAVVEASHEFGVTSEPVLVREGTDPHRIPRIDACQPQHVLQFETTDFGDRLKRTYRWADS